jgi:subtilisin family serine protease
MKTESNHKTRSPKTHEIAIFRLAAGLALVCALAAPARAAESRVVVRHSLGLSGITNTCALLRCTVKYGLGDPAGQVFLITTSQNVGGFLALLVSQLGVVNAELDQLAGVRGAQATVAPDALNDRRPVTYYGATVWNGYVNQPASTIVRRAETQSKFKISGSGIVAIIDTGIDPSHPAYKSFVVAGYDFTRDGGNGSEMGDVNQSTMAVVDGMEAGYVNQSTMAVVDQSTMAVVDNPNYAGFGHGTMVAGTVHLMAPTAKLMSLKAFKADGKGYSSDIIRAIYRAVNKNVNVINMSFSFDTPSTEVRKATEHATSKNIVCVSSAGNDGLQTLVYPAALNNVTGVGSTTDFDTRSTFSNYGAGLVWVAAPGEAIVTTYPWGTYAAGWGTSFSTPLVSGTAALMVQVSTTLNEAKSDAALANAKYVGEELNKGRLDSYRAVQAWRTALGKK